MSQRLAAPKSNRNGKRIMSTTMRVRFVIGWVVGDYVISRRIGIGPIDVLRLIIRRIKKSR